MHARQLVGVPHNRAPDCASVRGVDERALFLYANDVECGLYLTWRVLTKCVSVACTRRVSVKVSRCVQTEGCGLTHVNSQEEGKVFTVCACAAPE